MPKPAVFLDRDGTINEQMGYINHPSRLVLLPGAGKAIRRLNRSGHLVIVVSNQSGVARGYFPYELVEEVHERMRGLLALDGALLDGVFFCPHHPGGSVAPFAQVCGCRKPRTGLIDEAVGRLDIDLERSVVVGDRMDDIELAHRAGVPGILVRTGYGLGEERYILPRHPLRPAVVVDDLTQAVDWILGEGSLAAPAAAVEAPPAGKEVL
ncbi:D-glycero-alpha-D-manno-heptose-1,7-bisphosphate 7-phosphatase [Desulfatiglans anilini]|uniref:D-glycero-alpha-D-manno-heptose-1,7-bisphosphate 7-phosphatase n=1 Tax=Desulfatiglans anilini TaxID=90728 RepID=UPI0003FF06AC|nr:HAD family hydrolase [Desulfatiglans anilini]